MNPNNAEIVKIIHSEIWLNVDCLAYNSNLNNSYHYIQDCVHIPLRNSIRMSVWFNIKN